MIGSVSTANGFVWIISISCSKTAALTSSETPEVRRLYSVDHEARLYFFQQDSATTHIVLEYVTYCTHAKFLIVLKIVLSQDNIPFT